MTVGIICEGVTDRAVISNILVGWCGVQRSDIKAIRPEDYKDETDLANIPEENFSNWDTVREECISKARLRAFLSIEGNNLVVLQIDTAEAGEYEIERPIKGSAYVTALRERVIAKIDEWTGGEFTEDLIYAITIEEIEAWVLVIYIDRDTSRSADPKKALQQYCNKIPYRLISSYECYKDLSDKFSKKRNYRDNVFFNRNESLRLFCEQAKAMIALKNALDG